MRARMRVMGSARRGAVLAVASLLGVLFGVVVPATGPVAAGAAVVPGEGGLPTPRVGLVSAQLDGTPANSNNLSAQLSADGRRVFFSSDQTTLTPVTKGWPRGWSRAYFRDLPDGPIRLVGSRPDGSLPPSPRPFCAAYRSCVSGATMSGDGRTALAHPTQWLPERFDQFHFIALVDVDSGDAEVVRLPNRTLPDGTQTAATWYYEFYGVLSPNGRWVAMSLEWFGATGLGVYDRQSKRWRILELAPGDTKLFAPECVTDAGVLVKRAVDRAHPETTTLQGVDLRSGKVWDLPCYKPRKYACGAVTRIGNGRQMFVQVGGVDDPPRVAYRVDVATGAQVARYVFASSSIRASDAAGRRVLVYDWAAPNGGGWTGQLYLLDLVTGRRVLVSRAMDGSPSRRGQPSAWPSRALSDDGTVAVFASTAGNIVPGDRPGERRPAGINGDVFWALIPDSAS